MGFQRASVYGRFTVGKRIGCTCLGWIQQVLSATALDTSQVMKNLLKRVANRDITALTFDLHMCGT